MPPSGAELPSLLSNATSPKDESVMALDDAALDASTDASRLGIASAPPWPRMSLSPRPRPRGRPRPASQTRQGRLPRHSPSGSGGAQLAFSSKHDATNPSTTQKFGPAGMPRARRR